MKPTFTEEQRTNLTKRISALKASNTTVADITDTLNTEGFRKSNRKKIDKQFVYQWINRYVTANTVAEAAKAATPTTAGPTAEAAKAATPTTAGPTAEAVQVTNTYNLGFARNILRSSLSAEKKVQILNIVL